MSDDPQPSYVELTPNAPDVGRVGYKDPSPAPPLKVLFCDHPRRPLAKIRYCSYYGEMFYALEEVFDITFTSKSPSKVSDLGDHWDAIILGFAHTDVGERKPRSIIQDTNIPLFPILNKEYAGLEGKLNWIKSMNATAALTVHHDFQKYSNVTGVPFHRIMWSANEELFKDYKEDYKCDLFFCGVTRPEQTENIREKVLSNTSRLSDYKLIINNRAKKHRYAGKIFSPEEYARGLASSKICLITTGPADLVGTRYFEVMAGNKSLILCNKMSEKIYGNMLIDGYNCIMFSSETDFFDKARFYLENEEARVKIVNQAYNHFINSQTWQHRAQQVLNIIKKYIS